jgi:hypothetical protein
MAVPGDSICLKNESVVVDNYLDSAIAIAIAATNGISADRVDIMWNVRADRLRVVHAWDQKLAG